MQLSFYILTCNSEKYIDKIFQQVRNVADEIVVIDSGSTDRTKEIVLQYTGRLFVRRFDDFVKQRKYAMEKCTNEWVFFLDSDELPSDELIQSIQMIKSGSPNEETATDAYQVTRHWYVMGKNVHSLYPVCSPDTPVRLYRKSRASYDESCFVHETITGFTRVETIANGHIDHFTFETRKEIDAKLDKYTALAAIDAKNRGKSGSSATAATHAVGAFIKWYFLKGAYKDGIIGLQTGRYAYLYTYLKYMKLKRLSKTNKS